MTESPQNTTDETTAPQPDATARGATRPSGDLAEPGEDLAAALARAAPKRWWDRGTLVLGALILVVGGFLGGAQAQQHWGTAETPAPARAGGGFGRFAGGGTGGPPAGGGFGRGTGGGAAPAAAATTGKVKLVDGSTIYVQTAAGDVVTVRTDGRTTVQSRSSLKSVKAGQTVTVQGPAGADGTVTATSVTSGK